MTSELRCDRARRIARSIAAVGLPAYLAAPTDYMRWPHPMLWDGDTYSRGATFTKGDVMVKADNELGWVRL